MNTGGWCPRGRRSEDGRIPDCYDLQETVARSYAVRTEWTVRDSDGTLVVVLDRISSGTRLTVDLARKLNKPLKVIYLSAPEGPSLFLNGNSPDQNVASVVDWIYRHRIRVLNIAGPRASSSQKTYPEAFEFVCQLLLKCAAAG